MAGSDKETRRVDAGRDTDQSKNSVSQASSGKTKQQLKEQDAEWGFEPGKSGMATEAKMGMGIIVILVCAFGFLVYHKFDLRQRQLLAANVKAQGAEETDLQKAVADQSDAFSGFAAQPSKSTAKTELLEPEIASTQPTFDSLVADQSNALPQQPASVDAQPDRTFGAGGELFGGMDEPAPEPVNAFARTNAPSGSDADPFAMLDASSETRRESEPIAFQQRVEPIIEPDLFAASNARQTTSKPEVTSDFPAFDQASSVAVVPESSASVDVADSGPFSRLDAFPADPFPGNETDTPTFGDSPLNDQPPPPEEVVALDPISEAAHEDFRELPFSGDPASRALARSVSQTNQVVDLKAAPEFPLDTDSFGPSVTSTSLPPARLEEPSPRVANNSAFLDQMSTAITGEVRGSSNDLAKGQDISPPSMEDFHNVLAMLEPDPDVNLFEDPIDRKTKPPTTFPRDNETRIPAVEEPEMPRFDGLAPSTQQQVPDPVVERFPAVDESPGSRETFSSPNLFQEPIQQDPQPVPVMSTQPAGPSLPIADFDPVPQPSDPTPFDPALLDTRSLRPYEPELPPTIVGQPLNLGPEDGIARMVVPNRVQQTSGTYEHKEICEVRDKDNYWTISKRIYGTPRYFSSLALYNQHRIPDPRKLRPGMKVLVPEPKILESKYPEFFQASKATAATKPTGYFLNADGKPSYRVGENETLGAISQKHLGRASRWIQIYQMNRQSLNDPNRLKPGTVIALPDDATDLHVAP